MKMKVKMLYFIIIVTQFIKEFLLLSLIRYHI